MESHRVKTILLAILAIVNAMLLMLVWNQKTETMRYEQSALTGAIRVLGENGIGMEIQAVVDREGRYPGSTERSTGAEAGIASALLGEGVQGENRGGGLYTYTGVLGELSFRPGGVMSAVLAHVPEWETDDPEGHSASLLGRMGIEFYHARSQLSEDGGTVTYVQMLGGAPVFSCQIILIYEGGSLRSISGTLLAVEETLTETGNVLNLPTVLMRFLEEVEASGDVCSAILKVEPGYLVNHSFGNAIQLRPAWYISTNTADYYVDGVTGDVTRVMTA